MVGKILVAAALLAPAVFAQQQAWGQCGGRGWTGQTTCVSGYTCVAQNEWYSQCIPGTGGQTTTTPRTTTPTSRPTTTPTTMTTQTSRPTTTQPPGTAIAGNPFSGRALFTNPYYSSEIHTLAIPSLPSSLHAAASAVARTPTFMWMDTRAKVPLFAEYLARVDAQNSAGANPPIAMTAVVYDLPDRDCAAAASNGELAIANNGVALYRGYIDSIATAVRAHPNTRVIFVIEPDSLANLVTNLSVAKCSGAQAAYLECTQYALRTLNLPNVAMYLDAGHAGWLGWPANITPAADMFARLYTDSGRPASVRGLATNVANYNAWSLSSAPSYTTPNANYDESKYINAFSPMLESRGFPARFIVDTGRNGVQPTQQQQWGDWCNLRGTGFGVRPTTSTGSSLVDAFVWVKPGGESDGTSDTSAARYDFHCGASSALTPAPEAGTWFQAYFQQLLQNANPRFT